MNKRIEQKIEAYKKSAASGQKLAPQKAVKDAGDGLGKVIRSKKDADQFMAELNGIVSRAK